MEHHERPHYPTKFELAVTVTVKPIAINVTLKSDTAALAAITKDVTDKTGLLKTAVEANTPAT